MLDVVFILLIFFIVTAVFVKVPGIKVTSPYADTADDIKRVSTIIAISKKSEIWIDKRKVTLEDIDVVVAKLKLENPKGKIVVKADSKSNSSLVIQVVEKLNGLGIHGVAIAANKRS